jgi:hypothetical protein
MTVEVQNPYGRGRPGCRPCSGDIRSPDEGEQHAVIRVIDTELGLHRLGGQADLAVDDPSPACTPEFRVERLDAIGRSGVSRLQNVAQRRDRTGDVGVAKSFGGFFEGASFKPSWVGDA